jgi:hypothetical protein
MMMIKFGFHNRKELLDQLSNYKLLEEARVPWNSSTSKAMVVLLYILCLCHLVSEL